MTQTVFIATHADNTKVTLITDQDGAIRVLGAGDDTDKMAIQDGGRSVVVSGHGRFDFSMALALLRSGKRVARWGWNSKGMFLFLVPGSTFEVNRLPLLGIYPEGAVITYCPHIDMRTADGKVVPWLASQTDLLADDWHIVEG